MPSELVDIRAENLVITQEVSSAALFKARYTGVTWPGGSSGPTIGIGVDIGYTTPDELEHDWAPYLSPEMLSQLHRGVGVKGDRAHILVRSGTFNKVIVPWDAALHEFENVEIPRWVAKTNKTYPGLDQLGPLCEGAMMSVCFNRGTQLIDPPGSNRRLEMREIHDAIIAGHPEKVPGYLRSMKRLWTNGLVARREAEAKLFEEGLALRAQIAG